MKIIRVVILGLLLALGGVVPALAQGSCDPAVDYITAGNDQYTAGSFQQAAESFTCALAAHPNSAGLYNGRGNAYRNVGNFDAALSDYSRAIELDSDFAAAYNNRGWVYYQTARFDLALADLNRAIELDPALAFAYNNRGLVYQKQGKFEQAIADFNTAIALGHDPLGWPQHNLDQAIFERDKLARVGSTTPGGTGALSVGELMQRAYDSTLAGQYEQAIADYDQVIAVEPGNRDAHYNRGNAHFNLGDLEAALADFNRAIEIDPQYVDAYQYRGVVYENQESYEAALADYNHAIELDPGYMVAYFGRGNILRLMGEYEQAIAAYDSVLQFDPNYVGAYHNRGLTYSALGDYEQAIADYTRAMDLDASYRFLLYDRADAYIHLGRDQDALNDYNAALDFNPEDAPVYMGRGTVYLSQGDRVAAAGDFMQWLKLIQTESQMLDPLANGQNVRLDLAEGRVFYIPFEGEAGQTVSFSAESALADPLLVVLGPDEKPLTGDDDGGGNLNARILDFTLPETGTYTLVVGHAGSGSVGSVRVYFGVQLSLDELVAQGTQYQDAGEHAEAVKVYTKALELDPANADVYFDRGYSYTELAEYEKAIADFTQAIEFGYSSPALAFYNRAWSKRHLGQYEDALPDYDRALELDPQYANGYYDRGYNYSLMGDSEKAVADYNRALDLGYDEPQSIYYDRAGAYLDLEEWELAKADYNRVLQAEPDTPGAYLGRGIAYVGLNSRREAAADFAQWLTMQATLPVSAAIPEGEDTLTLEMVEDRWYTVAIKGEEGQVISVAADSSDMDPLLVIVSGQNEPLTGDDDGGDGLSALIQDYELPYTGLYYVYVGHAGGGAEGPLTLRVTFGSGGG